MNSLVNWFLSGFSSVQSAVAQLIGFVPLVLSFFVFLQTNRKKIIAFKTCSDLLGAIHFFVLGEFTGGMINLVNTFRNIIFANKNKKWGSSIFILILFCAFTVLCALPNFEGAKSFFPIVGSCLASIGFWQISVKRLRVFNLAGITLWLIYAILIVSVPTIISNMLSISSIILSLIREK